MELSPQSVDALKKAMEVVKTFFNKIAKAIVGWIRQFAVKFKNSCIQYYRKHGTPRFQKAARIYLTTKNSRIRDKQWNMIRKDFIQKLQELKRTGVSYV